MQIERVIKIPIEEIRIYIKSNYNIDLSGADPYIDGDNLAFSISTIQEPSKTKHNKIQAQVKTTSTKRRRKRKRSRIKTRGWKIEAQIENERGLKANIYEPFVKALEGKEIPRSEQRKLIRQIMIKNRNNPTEKSVDYYLDNTLEYLAQRSKKT